MSVLLLAGVLLREVPEHLAAGVSSGEFRVYGSIIRSLTSGRIVGHLQETSALTDMAGVLLGAPASLPLQASGLTIDAIGHTVSYVQNEQIKAALGVVQTMQAANLVLGAAAIGISIAGFAILSKKLSHVERKVDALDSKLDQLAGGIELIRRDRIAEDFVRLRTALEQLDEAWLLGDPVGQWRSVANETHFLANQFYRRAAELGQIDVANFSLAEPFIEALAIAANARVTARMAANDDAASQRAAEEGAAALATLGEYAQLGKGALAALDRSVAPATLEWSNALEVAADGLRPAVEQARMREAAAAATCLTIETLRERRIPGRTWLEAAREEQEAPLLCLLPAAA
jgi:hypothetical protein